MRPAKSTRPEAPAPAGWWPPNWARLAARIARGGPAAAVFDWDNTCILGDLGDRTSLVQLERAQLGPTPAQLAGQLAAWPQVPAALAADAVAALAAARRAPPAAAAAARQDLVATLGLAIALVTSRAQERTGEAFAWQAGLLAGLAPEAIEALAEQAWQAGLAEPVGEVVHHSAGAGAAGPVAWRRRAGLRPCPQVLELFLALAQAGIRPYVVTASAEPVVQAVLRRLARRWPGLSGVRVLGMPLGPPSPARPRTYRAGKVDAIRAHVPEPVCLAAGDADTDVEMLTAWAPEALALVVHRGLDGDIARLYRAGLAQEGGVLLQGRDPATGAFLPQPLSLPG